MTKTLAPVHLGEARAWILSCRWIFRERLPLALQCKSVGFPAVLRIAATSALLPRLVKAMMEFHPGHIIFLQLITTSRILFRDRRSCAPSRRPAGTPIVRLRVRHRHRTSDCERQRPCNNERFFHAMPLLLLLRGRQCGRIGLNVRNRQTFPPVYTRRCRWNLPRWSLLAGIG